LLACGTTRGPALLAHHVMIFTQPLCLRAERGIGEPRRLRYRIMHVADQVTRHRRRTTLHLPAGLAPGPPPSSAFVRLGALAA
jgi:hypothetical protein